MDNDNGDRRNSMALKNHGFIVVIPARFGSSRLPGKPLKDICGKTMIRRVYENAIESGADTVLVATDDRRIVDEVEGFGGRAMITEESHRSGTDRVAEVAKREGWSNDTVVVNLQGDEPFLAPALIRQVAHALTENRDTKMATLAAPITHANDLFAPQVVKVVVNSCSRALYFSRAPIPAVRDTDLRALEKLPAHVSFLRHIGLYAYRVDSLRLIADAKAAPLELAESLEQLRAMWLGIGIHVSVIDAIPMHGVDTEEDLSRVRKVFFN